VLAFDDERVCGETIGTALLLVGDSEARVAEPRLTCGVRPSSCARSGSDAGIACSRSTTGKHDRSKRKRRSASTGLAQGTNGSSAPGSPAHYRFDVIVITSASRGSLSDLVRSGQHASVTRIGVIRHCRPLLSNP